MPSVVQTDHPGPPESLVVSPTLPLESLWRSLDLQIRKTSSLHQGAKVLLRAVTSDGLLARSSTIVLLAPMV